MAFVAGRRMKMKRDMDFAVAILRSDYEKRKNYLLDNYSGLSRVRVSDALSELTDIKGAIVKIETAFKE